MTLTPTDSTLCVSVMIIDDSVFEETEAIILSISVTEELTGSVELSPNTTTLFILDDDSEIIGMLKHVWTCLIQVVRRYIYILAIWVALIVDYNPYRCEDRVYPVSIHGQ